MNLNQSEGHEIATKVIAFIYGRACSEEVLPMLDEYWDDLKENSKDQICQSLEDVQKLMVTITSEDLP